MRSIRTLFAAAALLLPTLAWSQAAVLGSNADGPCTGLFTDAGEMYGIKITASPTDLRNDMLFDLRAKGGLQSDANSQFNSGSWIIGPNWRATQAGSDVHYVIITYPPTGPGQPGRMSIDSASIVEFDAGLVHVQEVGNSLPTGTPGFNSIGLDLPGNSSPVSVTVRPSVSRTFPAGTTSDGINVAFAPLIDVNDADPSGSTCMWGAKLADPLDTTDTPIRRGVIIGYNVYRVPGTAGTVPTPADFKAALTDANPASGWVGFVDVRSLHQATADGPGAPPAGTPSPVEVSAAADIAGMQNPNGLPYDGDEVMIFQDSQESTRPRVGGAALQPNIGNSYWYAVQPVALGRVADFSGTIGWTPNAFIAGDHACDMNGDGTDDSVDLDTINCTLASIDFISPQANFGLDGLGLTNNSELLLSAPQFFDSASVLPAFGGIAVIGTLSGSDVSLQLTTGLEGRAIAGYNVYRQVGEQRVRVNEQPILAQGAESNVYSLLDTAVSSARAARATSVQYMVETVYSDGTASTFAGPFTVEIQPQQPARRRR